MKRFLRKTKAKNNASRRVSVFIRFSPSIHQQPARGIGFAHHPIQGGGCITSRAPAASLRPAGASSNYAESSGHAPHISSSRCPRCDSACVGLCACRCAHRRATPTAGHGHRNRRFSIWREDRRTRPWRCDRRVNGNARDSSRRSGRRRVQRVLARHPRGGRLHDLR